jgi:hypothetical protein
MRLALGSVLVLTAIFGPSGCGSTGGDDHEDSGVVPDSAPPCTEGVKRCEAVTNAHQVCTDGRWQTLAACPAACDLTLGCVDCIPNATACQGTEVMACTADGTLGEWLAHCEECADGTCTDPCGRAEVERSYVGCDYWPTVTMNASLAHPELFHFAVAVANAGEAAADITISGANIILPVTATVPPGELVTITLPWVPELRQENMHQQSILKTKGAFHLKSTQPVTAYQFNALEYKSETDLPCDDPSCNTDPAAPDHCVDSKCVHYSYTNDASLLLPRHALADRTGASSYLVMTRPTIELFSTEASEYAWWPGFFAVVATEDGTTVTVHFTANTMAGPEGSNIEAYTPGSDATFTLDTGSVLQIASGYLEECETDPPLGRYAHCNMAEGYDLTGTEITSDKPVAVFSGHDCDLIPYNRVAGDHLEEQLLPVATWGKHYVATKVISTSDPNLYRVLSSKDGTSVTFDPPVQDRLTGTALSTITLDRGKFVEFITGQDFEVDATEAVMVAGFVVGHYSSHNPGQIAPSDPSMCLVVPSEQYRQEYVFLAPDTYDQSYVNVVAPTGATVLLDDTEVSGWTAIGSTWSVAKKQITGGPHSISTNDEAGVGIEVYGVGTFTSYMFPGGLDVRRINPD